MGADDEPHDQSGGEGAAQRDAQRPPPGHLVEAQHWNTHTHTEGNKLMTKNTRGWQHITALKCEQKCDIIYIMDIAMNSLCFVNNCKLSAVQRCALLFSKACSNHDIALEQTLKG